MWAANIPHSTMSMVRAIILTSLRVSCARREGKPCQEPPDGPLPLTVTDREKMAAELRRADQPTSDCEGESGEMKRSDKWNLRIIKGKETLKCVPQLCERVLVRGCLCISLSKMKERRPRSLNKEAAGTSTQPCRKMPACVEGYKFAPWSF